VSDKLELNFADNNSAITLDSATDNYLIPNEDDNLPLHLYVGTDCFCDNPIKQKQIGKFRVLFCTFCHYRVGNIPISVNTIGKLRQYFEGEDLSPEDEAKEFAKAYHCVINESKSDSSSEIKIPALSEEEIIEGLHRGAEKIKKMQEKDSDNTPCCSCSCHQIY